MSSGNRWTYGEDVKLVDAVLNERRTMPGRDRKALENRMYVLETRLNKRLTPAGEKDFLDRLAKYHGIESCDRYQKYDYAD